MRLNTTVITSFAALLIAAFVFAASYSIRTPSAVAQVDGPLVSPVLAGDYKEFSTLRQLKLATAAYVNPSLYKAAEVAYSYDPDSFKGQWSPALIRALKDGDAWMGMASTDGETLQVFPQTEQDHVLFEFFSDVKPVSADEFARWLAGQQEAAVATGVELTLVSKSDAFFGAVPEGAFVSWEPKEAVTEPAPSRKERLDR